MKTEIKQRIREPNGQFAPQPCQADDSYWLWCGSQCHTRKIEAVCGVPKSKHNGLDHEYGAERTARYGREHT